MANRFWVSSGALATMIVAILLTPAFVAAQAKSAAAAKAPAPNNKAWSVPHTPDGQPDLQGYWTNLSFTPLERPAEYGTREFLTDEESAKLFKQGIQHSYEFTYDNPAGTPVYD